MTNNLTLDDAAEITEPLFDEASKELYQAFTGEVLSEVVSDLPVAKYAVTASKLYKVYSTRKKVKLIQVFLNKLSTGHKSIEEFVSLPDIEKEFIREQVIANLELQTHELQAEATALVVDAYLHKRIDQVTFVGLISEMKDANPVLFYFNVDAIKLETEDTGVVKAVGPTHLLPNTFGHNTITGIGLWDSQGDYKYVISSLGKQFFKHVYAPMSKTHLI